MSKTLRIVAKDARHLWPEILLYLGILLAFAAVAPLGWPSHFNRAFREAQTLLGFLQVLLPLTWWLLIARSVQDESLVGDRQFWTTRPYGWQRILAAKIIFITVIVALPYFLAKVWLLHYAGLSPIANVAPLFFSVVATALLIFLPLFAIAVVTANLVRMFFVVVVFCLFIGLVAYINSLFPSPQTFGPDTTPGWVLPLSICICVGVILLQYARRRTMIARTALIVATIAVASFTSIHEHSWNPHRLYQEQASNESLPLTVTLNPDRSLLAPPPGTVPDEANQSGIDPNEPDSPEIYAQRYKGQFNIPLLLSGVSPNHAVRIDNVTISYRTPHSGELTDVLQGGGRTYLPGDFHDAIHLTLFGPKEYRQLADQPLIVNLTIAVTELEVATSAFATAAASDFAVPNHGICHPFGPSDPNNVRLISPLQDCQFPLNRLPRTLVTARWSDQPCGQPSDSGVEGSEWIGSDDNQGWSLNFDPVQNIGINLSEQNRAHSKGYVPRFLCPGTTVKFTNYRVSRQRLLHVTLPPILPRDYTKAQQGTLGQSSINYGVD